MDVTPARPTPSPQASRSPTPDRQRLRIALAQPGGLEFGGIGRIMLYATRRWAEMADGPEVTLIDARGAGSILWMPWYLVKEMLRLTALRARDRLDLLHLNTAGRTSSVRKVILSELAHRLGLATVVHLHDYDYAQDLASRGPRWRRAVARMFARADRVIVLGRRDRTTVVDELAVAPERVVVLHNAVPDPGPPPDRAARHADLDGRGHAELDGRGHAGAAAKKPVEILFLGHLDDRKGVPELLAALERPAMRARSWRLTLAGGGELERFRREIAHLELQDRVSVPGWLGHEEVYRLLRAADLFVLPSHAEGQAMSLLEAMAHGLAIVTTPVGAHLEAVSDGQEAVIVPPGEVEALAGGLALLLDDGARRLEIGAAARARYLAGFTVDTYARRLLELYEQVLRERNMLQQAVFSA